MEVLEMKAEYKKYQLKFIRPGGTSRGILRTKETYILKIWQENRPDRVGRGEAALFRGLSADDLPDYERKLEDVCKHINEYSLNYGENLRNYPSIQFGIETALADLANQESNILFSSDFTRGKKGIYINGLIWMGSKDDMLEHILVKLDEGFRCLKLKIGAIDFETEIDILKFIRKKYSEQTLELRVDANGAFPFQSALTKLEQLAKHKIHSIEQPIKAGQVQNMAELCKKTPIPIALDEELIGIFEPTQKQKLLETVKPQYIILKPALVGAFSGAQEWIDEAEKLNINWWVTSALESNIGLNAIAQWTFTLKNSLAQGLGTGKVFANNFDSPLVLLGDILMFKPEFV